MVRARIWIDGGLAAVCRRFWGRRWRPTVAVVSEMAGEDTARGARGPDWREFAGRLGHWRTGAVRLGVGWLAVGPRREWPAQPKASPGEDAK